MISGERMEVLEERELTEDTMNVLKGMNLGGSTADSQASFSEFCHVLGDTYIRTCSRRRRVCRLLLPIPVCLGPPFPKKIPQDWVLPLFFLLGWQENRGEPNGEFAKIT